MRSFKSAIFTSFFLGGLPASVTLLLHFGEVVQIDPEAFFSVPFLVGTVLFNYFSTIAYLFAVTSLSMKSDKSAGTASLG